MLSFTCFSLKKLIIITTCVLFLGGEEIISAEFQVKNNEHLLGSLTVIYQIIMVINL